MLNPSLRAYPKNVILNEVKNLNGEISRLVEDPDVSGLRSAQNDKHCGDRL